MDRGWAFDIGLHQRREPAAGDADADHMVAVGLPLAVTAVRFRFEPACCRHLQFLYAALSMNKTIDTVKKIGPKTSQNR